MSWTTSRPWVRALALALQPSLRGSAKVPKPTLVITPGFFPAMARNSWAITPRGRV